MSQIGGLRFAWFRRWSFHPDPAREARARTQDATLPNFPPLVVAALWQKNLSRSNADFLAEIQRRARAIQPAG
jgi:hypothetical protein